MGLKIGQHVMAMLVPRARERTPVSADDPFKFWIRRVRREIFVRINFDIRRMIDRQHSYLVEVDSFLEWFHEAEAELAIFLADGIAIDFDVLDGARNVALPGPHPVSNHARAEHVGDKFIALTIPHKQRRARTAAAINL